MQKLVWKNSIGDEINLTDGNYGITEWEGFANTSLNIQSQQVPFQDGGVFLDALMEQRELSVTLAMNDGGNLETRYRLRRELIHALNPKLGEGYLIYTNDFISKRIKCVAQIPLFETHNSNDSGTPKASLAWTACEPYWEDLEETKVLIKLGELKNIQNNGDVSTQVKIELLGNATNPKIVNFTTSQKIELSAELSAPVVIETYLGKKKILEKDLSFVLEKMGNTIVDIIPNGEEVFFLCSENTSLMYDGERFYGVQIVGNAIIYSANLQTYFICGNKGTISKSTDLKNWTTSSISAVIQKDLLDINIASDNTIFAVGTGGAIVKSSDGNTWSTIESNTQETLNAIGIFYQNFVAVGNNGVVVYYTNNACTLISSGVSVNLNDVMYIGFYFKIVGNDGVVLSASSTLSNIEVVDIGTTEDLFRIYVDTNIETNVYYLGANGTIIKGHTSFIAGDYTPIETSGTNTFKAGGYSVKLNTYFFGGIGVILGGYNDTELTSILQGENYNFNDIQNINDILYCVGDNGLIYKRENDLWQKIASGTEANLTAIIYVEEKGFIIVGQGVVLSSQDGNLWSINDTLFQGLYLTSVAYSSKDKNFYITTKNTSGQYGQVYKTENFESKTLLYTNSKSNFLKIVYSEELDLFCVGGDNISSNPGGVRILITSDFVNVLIDEATNYIISDIKYIKSQKQFYITSKGMQYGFGYNDFLVTKGEASSIYGLSVESADLPSSYNNKDFQVDGFCYDEELGLIIGTSTSTVLYGGNYGSTVIKQGIGAGVLAGVLDNNKDFVFVGKNGLIEKVSVVESEKNNFISKLTPSSDINFNLSVGNNQLRLLRDSGNYYAILTYRQKYIGV